jgi:anti-sigma B factor antagonist
MSSRVQVPHPSEQPSLAVSHRRADDGACVVTPAGEIDLASAPQLKSSLMKLVDEGYARFVIDLSEVRYLDSTGLGVLIAFSRRLGDEGKVLLAQAPTPVLRLLELTGLDAVFETFATVEDALAPVKTAHQTAQPPLCPDAAIVVGLASAALPFAESSLDELRRWVRILSVHGEAARALQRVGLTDVAIDQPALASVTDPDGPQAHADSVVRVSKAATAIAVDRDADCVTTVDLLLAVMTAYGDAFDRELRGHGSSAVELIECLGTSPEPAAVS